MTNNLIISVSREEMAIPFRFRIHHIIYACLKKSNVRNLPIGELTDNGVNHGWSRRDGSILQRLRRKKNRDRPADTLLLLGNDLVLQETRGARPWPDVADWETPGIEILFLTRTHTHTYTLLLLQSVCCRSFFHFWIAKPRPSSIIQRFRTCWIYTLHYTATNA